jgi:hypothetical protein
VKIHEYQAKKILAQYGVPIPRGEVANSPYEAYEIARRLGGTVVVKAQIHAGGRGKGGGVKLARTPEEAEDLTRKILGMTLITHQSGRPHGPSGSDRGRPPDQKRVLSGHRRRSRQPEARDHGFPRRRDGYRKGSSRNSASHL